MFELHHILYVDNYDLLLITETWLHCDISSGLLDPKSHYYILRKDRVDRGGGVCAFVKRDFSFSEVDLAARYRSLELICFDVINAKSKLRFFVVYRAPQCDKNAAQNLALLLECLEVYSRDSFVNVIAGDLNCPDINWCTLYSPDDNINKPLLDFTVAGGFCQCVNFATRDKNILDVILVDDCQLIGNVASVEPLGSSDHLIVQFSMVLDLNVSCSTCNERNWSKADYDEMELYLLDIDWQWLLLNNPSALLLWDKFESIVTTAIDLFVPKRQARSSTARTKRRYPRCMLKLRAEKRRIWRRLQVKPDDQNIRAQYRASVNKWRYQLHDWEKQTEMRIIESGSIGTFYNYVNGRISYRSGISALTDSAGNIVVENDKKANMFNEHFASVGTVDNKFVPTCVTTVTVLETVEFNAGNVMAAIKKVKSNLSAGPDGFPPVMFKRLMHCLAGPLAMLFTQLLSVAAVPNVWKSAVITPVFKKRCCG